MPSVECIVINWNAKSVIGKCIKSLWKAFGEYDFKITVVDNNSTDGSVQYLKSKHPDINLIASKKNNGFAVANNIAVKNSTADILLFVNPDTEIISGSDLLIDYLKQEEISACFGRLRYPNGEYQNFIRNFPSLLNQVAEIFFLPRFYPKKHELCEIIRVEDHKFYSAKKYIYAASGAFFGIKRKIFEEVGRFDEDYFVYGEETDLFYKMKQKKRKIFYDPNIEILHHHGESTSQNPMMYIMLQKNRLLFIKKNYGNFAFHFFRYATFIPYDLSRFGINLFLSIVRKNLKFAYKKKAFYHFKSLQQLLNVKGI